LETPPFRLPPVTLTLDLTLLEFFNYTTSTKAKEVCMKKKNEREKKQQTGNG